MAGQFRQKKEKRSRVEGRAFFSQGGGKKRECEQQERKEEERYRRLLRKRGPAFLIEELVKFERGAGGSKEKKGKTSRGVRKKQR